MLFRVVRNLEGPERVEHQPVTLRPRHIAARKLLVFRSRPKHDSVFARLQLRSGRHLYFPASSFSECAATRSSRKCEYICQSAAGLERSSALPCVAPTIRQVFCAGVSFTIARFVIVGLNSYGARKSTAKVGDGLQNVG